MEQNTIVRLANRTLTVHKSRVKSYLARGYDEVNEAGEVITRATGGKTITVQEHNKALDKIEELEGQLADLEDTDAEALKKENAALKGKITKLEKELDANKK